MALSERSSVLKVIEGASVEVTDTLVTEQDFTICFNGKTIHSTTCSPTDLEILTVGYLLSEGWIGSPEAIRALKITEGTVTVEAEQAPATRPLRVESELRVTPKAVVKAMESCTRRGKIFQRTGATHAAALAEPTGALCSFFEDVSRTCALEKVLGEARLKNRPLAESMIVVSSRVPRHFVRKIALVGIPIMVAISAPTWDAVQEADRLGICLCGFVRESRFNVYSHVWRVGL
jgi:FdhD protein